MARLVDDATTAEFSGILQDHFDEFTYFSPPIVVFKQPIKTIVSNPDVYAGYGNSSNAVENFTYTPVSGVFKAMALYNPAQENSDFTNQTKARFAGNKVTIKVKQDARDYIMNGKTESILVDGNLYNTFSFPKTQGYLGCEFFYFDLEGTN